MEKDYGNMGIKVYGHRCIRVGWKSEDLKGYRGLKVYGTLIN